MALAFHSRYVGEVTVVTCAGRIVEGDDSAAFQAHLDALILVNPQILLHLGEVTFVDSAGLGMLDGMMRLLPTAEVGFLGMVRNEETLEASTYAERLPENLAGRQCYLLDPMLATGGTLAAAIRFLVDRGADDITAICLLAAPEGCANLEAGLAGVGVPVTIVTAAMDEKLNDRGYIVPGLGDAGDRTFGTR